MSLKKDIIEAEFRTTGQHKVHNEINNLNKEIRELEQSNERLRMAKVKLEAQGKKNTAEYRNLNARISENNKTIKTNKERLKELNGQLKLSEMSMSQLRKELRSVSRELNATSRAMEPEKWKQLHQRQKAVKDQMTKLKSGASGVQRAFQSLKAPTLSLIATLTALYFGVSRVLGKFTELSDKLADVQKTTGLTKQEVKDLDKELLKLNTRSSRNELLELARVAGKLGVQGKNNILGFVSAADKINVALSEDLGGDTEEAIRQVGKLVDIFKIKDQYGLEQGLLKMGSAINALGASSTANEGYIVEFTKRLAGIAPNANISAADSLGLAATMDQLGQASEVSTTVISKLVVAIGKDIPYYSKVAKMGIGEFTSLLQTDTNEAILRVLEGSNGSESGLIGMVSALEALDVDGQRAATVLGVLTKNTETLREQQSLANREFQKGTSLTQEFNTKNETLAGNLQKIGKSIQASFMSSKFMGFLENQAAYFASLADKTESYDQTLQSTLNSFNAEIAILNTANLSQEQRATVIGRINDKYGDYLPNLIDEKAKLDDIKLAQDQVNESIMSKILLIQYEEEISRIMENQVASAEALVDIEVERAKNKIDTQDKGAIIDIQNELMNNFQSLHESIISNTDQQIAETQERFKSMAEKMKLDWETIFSGGNQTPDPGTGGNGVLSKLLGIPEGDPIDEMDAEMKELFKVWDKEMEDWDAKELNDDKDLIRQKVKQQQKGFDEITQERERFEEQEFRAQINQANEIMNMGAQIGNAIANLLADTEAGFKEFSKGILTIGLRTLEQILTQAIAERTIKAMAKGGPFNPVEAIKAAASIAGMKAAFGLAERAINSFHEGGHTGPGRKMEVAGVVHKEEYVVNRDGYYNPTVRPFIDVMEKARQAGTLRSLNLPAAMQGYSDGGHTASDRPLPASQPVDPELSIMIRETRDIMRHLNQRGVQVNWGYRDSRNVRRDLDTLDEMKSRSSRQ